MGRLGYAVIPKQRQMLEDLFHGPYYSRHTARRLEHLASLGLPVAGKSVLEVGAGIGDLSHFYMDRGARITITETRPDSLGYLRFRYPEADIRSLDLENPVDLPDAPFDVVHCYGVLYHLSRPAEALAFLSRHCGSFLVLETRVSYGDDETINPVNEIRQLASEAASGGGCRPTRTWVTRELRQHFPYVYLSKTQPDHHEFPVDWTAGAAKVESSRAIWVASRQPLDLPSLVTEIPARQFRSSQVASRDRTALSTDFMAIGNTNQGLIAYHLADTVIGRSIELYGEWAADETRFLSPYLRPGDVAIDVGANIGTHTVAFAKLVGDTGAVHAFEPQRLTFQLLCANAALNGLTNVRSYQKAVSTAPGDVKIPLPDLRRGENIGNFSLGDAQDGEVVPVIALDSLELPKVKLLKIDVEGMEADVLLGARKLIAKTQPVIFIENNIAEKSRALIQLLDDLGYRCWWHLASYYNPDNFYGNPHNIFAGVGRPEINMLCLPRTVEATVDGCVPVAGPEDTWQAALARSKSS